MVPVYRPAPTFSVARDRRYPDTSGMTSLERLSTAVQWTTAIEDACAEPDPARSNRLITMLHYLLSEALADQLGRTGGPNFHSWAVWGSRKAGCTIRQEDLESAVGNATATAGVVGSVVGAVTGIFAGRLFPWAPDFVTAALGAGIGTLSGGWGGRQLAVWSRARAADLILQGNRTVIQEIGEQSARFLELLEDGATPVGRDLFFAGLRPGATEHEGQDRLASAFRSYLAAYESTNVSTKRAAMIAGNCEIVYHEHIRLEPYIRGSMPFIIRRCVTQRWMDYEVGARALTVSQNLPGTAEPTAAENWAHIDQRMRYVFALFREFHNAPEVFAPPFSAPETEELKEALPFPAQIAR
jgi:hypothetical protein